MFTCPHITDLCYYCSTQEKKIIPRQSFSLRTHTNIKSKTLYLRTSFSCLQLFSFGCDLEIKKKQINSRQSSGTEFPLFLCREMLCWGSEREEMVRGWWKQRRRETESNNYSVKTFVFSERGQFSSWEHLSSSAPTVAPLWMCSTVPQDVGFRKPFFLQGGRPLPCLLCLQRQEGVGSASSLSQERSAIWEVSTWGQGMTSVTLYRPNPSDLEHSHARCFFQLCYLAFFMNLYEKAAEAKC